MRPTLFRTFSYGKLLVTLICLSRWTFAQQPPGDSTVSYSGNYRMLRCGSSGQTGSQASILQDILSKVRGHLQAVVTDAQLGTSSAHGFTAFFKTDDNRAAVLNLFQRLIDAPPIVHTPQRAQRTGRLTAPPTFVCANPGDPHVKKIYNSLCAPHMHTPAGQSPDTEVVGLCPLFWRMRQDGWIEPLSGFCPILMNNALSPNTHALTSNQMSVIVHELVHLYGQTTDPETYNIQDAVELNATASMHNAANFAFYFAAVVAGCTTFPVRPNTKDELRS